MGHTVGISVSVWMVQNVMHAQGGAFVNLGMEVKRVRNVS